MKNGIVLINKPKDMTSFAVVANLRKRLGTRCGHSGTLDPLATGLLPVMCGKATKLCSYLTNGKKAYRAELTFGIATDTYDITGNIIKTDNKSVIREEIDAILPEFTGEIKQIPPAFSAIKVGGTALYKLARKGQAVDVPMREITVYSIDVIDFSDKRLILDIECSKGTYIRSLCNDIALRLGTVGTMSALTRIKTGRWTLDGAVELDCDDIESHIISMDEALSDFPVFEPGKFYGTLLKNGCAIDISKLKNIPEGISRVYCDGLIGLGKINDENCYKIITHL